MIGTISKDQIIESIPRYLTGFRKSQPKNDRFRHIEILLMRYKFSDDELVFFQKEIDIWREKRMKRLEKIKELRQKRKEEQLKTRFAQ